MLSTTTRRTTSSSLLRTTRGGGPASLTSFTHNLSPLNASSSPSHHNNHQLEQRRTLLGLVHAIDKRVYRWAKGVLPPISKTENIALGCGTIGAYLYIYIICVGFDIEFYIFCSLTPHHDALQFPIFDGFTLLLPCIYNIFFCSLSIISFSSTRIRPRHLLRQTLPPTSHYHLPALHNTRRRCLP